jgi:glyoxylase-like metal-dependent hydrolase (beta-lactamase superfamily II)
MHIKIFQFNPFQENTYVLSDDTGEAVIIDCGCLSSDEDERLTLYLATEKLQVKRFYMHERPILRNYKGR